MNEAVTTFSTREERDQTVVQVLLRVLFLNLLVAVLKLVFGAMAGAVSMVADGLHSIMDSASNVVGLVGIGIARRAPDQDHPYGHRKFEALAALAISIFLFFTAWEVMRQVLTRFQGDHEIHPSWETFAVVIGTIVVNIFVTRYEKREGDRTRSAILHADARHTLSDVYVSFGVLGSLIGGLFNFPVLDLIVAVVITIFIAYSGYQIVVSAFSVLADAQVVDPHAVVQEAMRVSQVTHAHRVRSRGLQDDVHMDLHIHVPPEISVHDAHELAHEVADRIKAAFLGVTDVVVHVEPEGHGEDDH